MKKEENKSIAFLKEYRTHPDKYLPMIDHQYKLFREWDEEVVYNLYWDAGIMDGNRPYFAECWKVFLTTSLTVFFSAEGFDDVKNDLYYMLELVRDGMIAIRKEDLGHIKVMRIKDGSGREFISFNCVLSIEEKATYVSWLRGACRFNELNALNFDAHRIKEGLWEESDFFMTASLAGVFEKYVGGRVVRCQVFPRRGNSGLHLVSVELENGDCHAIADGPMGPRIMKLEAYADESNSYFCTDEQQLWHWRWKSNEQDIKFSWQGGIDW